MPEPIVKVSIFKKESEPNLFDISVRVYYPDGSMKILNERSVTTEKLPELKSWIGEAAKLKSSKESAE
jgi:hypothetical protein